jgi:hypothetical protein
MAHDLLTFMLEVFLRKFQLIAKQYMPAIMDKFDEKGNMKQLPPGILVPTQAAGGTREKKTSADESAPIQEGRSSIVGGSHAGSEESTVSVKDVIAMLDDDQQSSSTGKKGDGQDPTKTSASKNLATPILGTATDVSAPVKKTAADIGRQYWGVSAQPLSVPDCRNMVKTLVGGVKSIIWALAKGGDGYLRKSFHLGIFQATACAAPQATRADRTRARVRDCCALVCPVWTFS